jgi:hypothetical protein
VPDLAEPYVFIAHKSEDKPRVRPIVEKLLQGGLSVWIDNPEHFKPALAHKNLRRLRGGQNFRKRIPERIEESACVLVLWSTLSVRSQMVCEEASLALHQDKLVPAQIDQVKFPYGFGDLKTTDLTGDLNRHLADPSYELDLASVIDDIKEIIATRPAVPNTPHQTQVAAPFAPPVRVELHPPTAFRATRVDPKVTYLLDRDQQVADFATHICRAVRASDGLRRPSVALLAAPRSERPDTFLESICYRSRDMVRNLLGHDFDLIRKPFAWPECGSLLKAGSPNKHLASCISKVGAGLNVPEGLFEFDADVFLERLTDRLREVASTPDRAAVVLTTHIYPDRWTGDDEVLLLNFMKWWQDLMIAPGAALPVLVISIIQPATSSRMGWLRRKLDVAAFLDRLQPGAFPGLNVLKLGPLGQISAQHAHNWVEHILPRHLDRPEFDFEPLRREIGNRFALAPMQSLDEVARWLQGVLEDDMAATLSASEGVGS